MTRSTIACRLIAFDIASLHPRVGERVAVERAAALVGHAGGRLAALIEGEEDRAPGDLLLQAEARRRADALQVRGRDVLDRVEVVGEQRGDAGAVVRHDAEDRPGPRPASGRCRRRCARARRGRRARSARACRVRCRSPLLPVLKSSVLAPAAAFFDTMNTEFRSYGTIAYGVAVFRRIVWRSTISFADDRPREGRERAGARRERRRAVDRERDVLGGELRAVAEPDAFAELELPGRRVDRPPRLREAGHEPHVLVDVRRAPRRCARRRCCSA